jgi:hypothetical protein
MVSMLGIVDPAPFLRIVSTVGASFLKVCIKDKHKCWESFCLSEIGGA